jgi:hypothetical protein
MKKLSLISFGLAIVLLSSGCASFRVKTDLVPETDAKLQSPAGMFYIAGLKYSIEDTGASQPNTPAYIAHQEKQFLALLRKECPAQYPLLFSKEEGSAIPLFVTVANRKNPNVGKELAFLFLTLTICGNILPAPRETDLDLTVLTSVWNGVDGPSGAGGRKQFHREERGWFSLFTPLGLITIPGESDFPKAMQAGNPFLDNSLQIAQQVATALAKIIESKGPDFWTSSSRREQLSGSAPVPAIQSAPLPPPTEPIQPF